MITPPPLVYRPPPDDASQLRLLTILHYVMAGLAVLMLGFLLMHFLVLNFVFSNPEMWKQAKHPPPKEIFVFFKLFYIVGATLIIAVGVANLLSAFYIRDRKNRLFSLILAGINCMHFPLGTGLGVFTFIVLLRPSVIHAYESSRDKLPGPHA